MNKINIVRIIRNHFNTMRNSSGKLLFSDMLIHILFPAISAIVIVIKTGIVNKDILSSLVNFGAITTALLMGAIVMIYDQKNKTLEKTLSATTDAEKRKLSTREDVYSQLCSNICYAILASIFIVVLSIACLFRFIAENSSTSENILITFAYSAISVLIFFFFISSVITFLMIMKRFSLVVEN